MEFVCKIQSDGISVLLIAWLCYDVDLVLFENIWFSSVRREDCIYYTGEETHSYGYMVDSIFDIYGVFTGIAGCLYTENGSVEPGWGVVFEYLRIIEGSVLCDYNGLYVGIIDSICVDVDLVLEIDYGYIVLDVLCGSVV